MRSIMAKSPRTKSAPVKPPRFREQARQILPGSEKAAVPSVVPVKATPARSQVTVSVIVKRKKPLKVNSRGGRANGPARVSLTEFKKQHGGDPDAIKKVKAFAREFNLKVERDPTAAVRRTVKLTGSAADIQKAFGTVLEQKLIDGEEYRVRQGGIELPASLAGCVEAVLGLDNRPQAQPHFRVCKFFARTTAPSSYGCARGEDRSVFRAQYRSGIPRRNYDCRARRQEQAQRDFHQLGRTGG
jgi:kumamolisin